MHWTYIRESYWPQRPIGRGRGLSAIVRRPLCTNNKQLRHQRPLIDCCATSGAKVREKIAPRKALAVTTTLCRPDPDTTASLFQRRPMSYCTLCLAAAQPSGFFNSGDRYTLLSAFSLGIASLSINFCSAQIANLSSLYMNERVECWLRFLLFMNTFYRYLVV